LRSWPRLIGTIEAFRLTDVCCAVPRGKLRGMSLPAGIPSEMFIDGK